MKKPHKQMPQFNMSHSMNDYKNVAENNMSCMMKLCTCCKDHTDDMLKNIHHTVNKNFADATELGHAFFKCRTAQDMIALQQKMFEVSYKNSLKCCVEMMDSVKDLSEKNTKIFSQNMQGTFKNLF
jgi:hypothetical protein